MMTQHDRPSAEQMWSPRARYGGTIRPAEIIDPARRSTGVARQVTPSRQVHYQTADARWIERQHEIEEKRRDRRQFMVAFGVTLAVAVIGACGFAGYMVWQALTAGGAWVAAHRDGPILVGLVVVLLVLLATGGSVVIVKQEVRVKRGWW